VIFSLGNVITLIIVVLLFVLTRWLDGKNRSLSHARNYGKKLKDELKEEINVFVNEKTREIKDYGVELNVNVDAAKVLKTNIDSALALLNGRQEIIEELNKRIGEYGASLKELSAQTARVDENLTRIENEAYYIDDVSQKIDASKISLQNIETESARLRERIEGAVSIFEKSQKEQQEKAEKEMEAVYAVLRKAAEKAGERASVIETDIYQKIINEAQERSADIKIEIHQKIDALFSESKDKISDISKFVNDETEKLHACKDDFENTALGLRKTDDNTKKEVLALEQVISSHKTMVMEKLNGITENLENIAADAKRKALEQADAHLAEFEKAQDERYQNLAALADDVENLQRELTKKLNDASLDWAAQINVTQERITEISSGLEQIKAEAARNTDEKMRIFENEFGADLEKRKEKIDAQFDIWLRGVSSDLESLKNESEDAFRAASQTSADNWRGSINSIEKRITDELSRLKEETAAFENSVRDEQRIAESSVEALKESIKAGMEEARESAGFELKTAIAKQNSESAAKLKDYKDGIDESLKAISTQIDNKTSDLALRIEKAREDGERADAEAARRIEAAREAVEKADTEFARHIEAAQEAAGKANEAAAQQIAGLRQEYEGKINDFNSGIENKLDIFDAGIQERLSAANVKCGEQIAAIRKMIDALSDKNEEIKTKGDRELTRLLSNIDDVKNEVKKESAEIISNTETHAKELFDQINAAAAQIKDFYQITEFIDKSVKLKDELKKKTGELQIEVERIEQRRAEIDRVEAQFAKVKRLEDDVNAKMQHFLTEESRINLMEKNFERLLTVSHSVEEKLTEVTGSDDMLQKLSIRIRQLSDSMRDAEEKYDRLENKKFTLDATLDRIDTNYKSLEETEKRAEQFRVETEKRTEQFRAEMSLFNSQLEEVKTEMDSINSESKKANEIIGKVSVLDAELSHIEKRIEEMQRARQWLAGIETRLDTRYRELKGQVKMLGDGIDARRGSISPSSPEAQTEVRALKRRGFTNVEIAQTMKMSIGEVALILEVPERD
jgi:chromosome segregation ATPase